MRETYRMDDGQQTLVIAASAHRLPLVVYWGAPLPEGEQLDAVCDAYVIDVTGGMLDANPDLSLCPEARHTFPGQPGFVLYDKGGLNLSLIHI